MQTGDLAIIRANIQNCHEIAVPDKNTIECTWRREKGTFTKQFIYQDDQFIVKNLQYNLEGELIHEATLALRPFDWQSALNLARQRLG